MHFSDLGRDEQPKPQLLCSRFRLAQLKRQESLPICCSGIGRLRLMTQISINRSQQVAAILIAFATAPSVNAFESGFGASCAKRGWSAAPAGRRSR
jgi:hypothetical protein